MCSKGFLAELTDNDYCSVFLTMIDISNFIFTRLYKILFKRRCKNSAAINNTKAESTAVIACDLSEHNVTWGLKVVHFFRAINCKRLRLLF